MDSELFAEIGAIYYKRSLSTGTSTGLFYSYKHFQKNLLDSLMLNMKCQTKGYESGVNNLIKLVEIVYLSHIKLSAKKWIVLANRSKKISLQSHSDKITDDLHEAEKCFRGIMSEESITEYESLVNAIEKEGGDK